MPILCEHFTAPASWASYLVNGDDSGLRPGDRARADAWAATLPGPIVDAEEAGFSWHHDAQGVTGPLGATVARYTVHRQASAQEALEDAQERLGVALGHIPINEIHGLIGL